MIACNHSQRFRQWYCIVVIMCILPSLLELLTRFTLSLHPVFHLRRLLLKSVFPSCFFTMSNFASLITLFTGSNVTQYLTKLRRAGICSAESFARCPTTLFHELCEPSDIPEILTLQAKANQTNRQTRPDHTYNTTTTPTRRPDFPARAQGSRSSIHLALAVTQNNESKKRALALSLIHI